MNNTLYTGSTLVLQSLQPCDSRTLHQRATHVDELHRYMNPPASTITLRLLLQNCTTFIHLRLFSFYFTFGFTPLPPAPPLPPAAAVGFCSGKKPVHGSSEPDQRPRPDSELGLNWSLVHFTGHHAIQIQKKKQSHFSNIKSFLLVVNASFQFALGCGCSSSPQSDFSWEASTVSDFRKRTKGQLWPR